MSAEPFTTAHIKNALLVLTIYVPEAHIVYFLNCSEEKGCMAGLGEGGGWDSGT